MGSSAASARRDSSCRSLALLEENPTPDEAEIREALSGNICRCTGYESIVNGVLRAAGHVFGLATDPLVARERLCMQNIAERYTGASVRRSEDPRILTGAGRYIDDVRLPGMLHAAFVRSPFPHARITKVDVAEARRAPGVVLVLTGEELEEMIVAGPGLAGMFAGGAPVAAFSQLATDKVRVVGDPIVLVVAESRYLAEDACEMVEVHYEELPAVATAEPPSTNPTRRSSKT